MTTLSDLITRVRQISDIPATDEYVSDEVLTIWINDAYAEMYGLFVTEDYLTSYVDLNLTGSVYGMPDTLLKVRAAWHGLGTNQWEPISQVPFGEATRFNTPYSPWLGPSTGYAEVGRTIRFFPEGVAPGNVRLWFIPDFVPLASGSNETLPITFSQQRWDNFIVAGAALNVKAREDTDPSFLVGMKAQVEQRVKADAANRDLSGLERWAHVENFDDTFPWMPRAFSR